MKIKVHHSIVDWFNKELPQINPKRIDPGNIIRVTTNDDDPLTESYLVATVKREDHKEGYPLNFTLYAQLISPLTGNRWSDRLLLLKNAPSESAFLELEQLIDEFRMLEDVKSILR